MRTAIEFFNRPSQSHRHEIAAQLAVAAWEKLLKAYLHKTGHNIFYKDGRTKDFDTCRNLVLTAVHSSDPIFVATHENLATIYHYRNASVHFYGQHLDAILHGIFAECIGKYAQFLRQYFSREVVDKEDLGILPVGYSRPIVPEDFLSEHSASTGASREVRHFLKALHDAGERLYEAGIAPEHSVLLTFRIALEDAKKATRAQLIVGVDNTHPQAATLTVAKHVTLTGDIRLTKDDRAPVVRLVEEDIWQHFNLLTRNVTDFLRQSLPHVKQNQAFHRFMRAIQQDENICRIRYLDPNNPNSSKQKRYSDLIYQALLEQYGEFE